MTQQYTKSMYWVIAGHFRKVLMITFKFYQSWLKQEWLGSGRPLDWLWEWGVANWKLSIVTTEPARSVWLPWWQSGWTRPTMWLSMGCQHYRGWARQSLVQQEGTILLLLMISYVHGSSTHLQHHNQWLTEAGVELWDENLPYPEPPTILMSL